jgi:hypothetical protein
LAATVHGFLLREPTLGTQDAVCAATARRQSEFGAEWQLQRFNFGL